MVNEEHQKSSSTVSLNTSTRTDFHPPALNNHHFSQDNPAERHTLEGKPLSEYFALFLQYWMLILGCVIFSLTTAIVTTNRAVRIYQASALVNIGAYVPPLNGPMADVLRVETTRKDYVDSQIELLKSYSIARIALSNNPQIAEYIGLDPSLIQKVANLLKEQKQAVEEIGNLTVPEIPLDKSVGIDLPVSALDAYLGLVSYNQIPSTSLVKIVARAKTPELASIIANAHANAFVTIVVHQRLLSATVNMQFLKERARQASQRSKEAEAKMLETARSAGINMRNDADLQELFNERYQTTIGSLNKATLDRSGYQGMLRELRNFNSNQSVVHNDPASRELFIKLQELKGEYDTIRKIKPNAPALKFLKTQIAAYKAAISAGNEQDLKDVEIKYRSSLAQEKLLSEQLAALQREETKAADDRIQFTYLEKESKASKEIFEQISKRLEDAIVNAQNDQKTVVVVDPAIPLPTPISPNIKSNLITGALLGLLVGCAIVYWIDFSDRSIRSTADIKRTLNAQLLGVVPSFQNMDVLDRTVPSVAAQESPALEHTSATESFYQNQSEYPSASGLGSMLSESGVEGAAGAYQEVSPGYTPPTEVGRSISEDSSTASSGTRRIPRLSSSTRWQTIGIKNRRKRTKGDSSLVMINSPLSSQSEAFRNIRTTLKLASATPPQLLLVTSAQKGDGKSTIAANLAIAFAQLGARTLLLDADLRLPTVHKLFGISPDAAGLSDYLLGESDYAEAILQTSVANLQLLPAGPPDPCPAELLGSRRMVELLEILAADYDQIIIDTPPVTVVSDGLLLARLVDGAILVVRSGKTPKMLAQFGLNRLRQVHSEVLGVVLNDATAARTYGEPEYHILETNNDYFKKALILQKPKSKSK